MKIRSKIAQLSTQLESISYHIEGGKLAPPSIRLFGNHSMETAMRYSASFPIPQNMMDTIEGCTAGLGIVGYVGGALGAGADLIVIAPTWAGMTVTLAAQAGSSLDEQTAKKLSIAVATGVGSFVLGAKVASTVLGWLLSIPSAGVSVLASCAANAALNAKFTHAYGKAVARYFLQTDRISSMDIAVSVLVALVGAELGLHIDTATVIA